MRKAQLWMQRCPDLTRRHFRISRRSRLLIWCGSTGNVCEDCKKNILVWSWSFRKCPWQPRSCYRSSGLRCHTAVMDLVFTASGVVRSPTVRWRCFYHCPAHWQERWISLCHWYRRRFRWPHLLEGWWISLACQKRTIRMQSMRRNFMKRTGRTASVFAFLRCLILITMEQRCLCGRTLRHIHMRLLR